MGVRRSVASQPVKLASIRTYMNIVEDADDLDVPKEGWSSFIVPVSAVADSKPFMFMILCIFQTHFKWTLSLLCFQFMHVLLNCDSKFRCRLKFGLLAGFSSFLQMSRKFDSKHCMALGKRQAGAPFCIIPHPRLVGGGGCHPYVGFVRTPGF